MTFNSLKFFTFFIITYLLIRLFKLKGQNRSLLVASYYFYFCWDWRFLLLIIISTIFDYFFGIKIGDSVEVKQKKKYVTLSIIFNLAILCFFKYFNFFTDNFISLLSIIGINLKLHLLNIILPVGISFYTLQKMTYTIDIFRNEMRPTRDIINFALFVSFFPQLIAGPIERAKRMLPQFENERTLNKSNFFKGLELIFWGLFLKVFIADNLALIVDRIYGDLQSSGYEYIIATWAFAFQLYGDFSGYSNIARGIAKCLGIEIMENFKSPYLSVNPSDFWRRWHISLSSWLRDYLYVSLGGSRNGNLKTYRNLMITMFLSGLWHGAAWNYIIWGMYHGALLCIHRTFLKTKMRIFKFSNDRSFMIYVFKIFIFFQIICFGWIFFRSQNVVQIQLILNKIFISLTFSKEWMNLLKQLTVLIFIPLLAMIIGVIRESRPEWFNQKDGNVSLIGDNIMYIKSILYGIFIYLFCFYGASAKTFIYSNF